jgi:hypothetical protein
MGDSSPIDLTDFDRSVEEHGIPRGTNPRRSRSGSPRSLAGRCPVREG